MNSHLTGLSVRERLIVALDVPTQEEAMALVAKLSGKISFFKIGLQLFTAAGPEIVRKVAATGAKIFLDLKLHDIPNTVAKAVAAASELDVQMLTLHLSGGRAMIEAAVAVRRPGLTLLGVTILTSADEQTMRDVGVQGSVEDQVLRLAQLGKRCGVDGLVASPHEVTALRAAVGEAMTIVTPGVRPNSVQADDQKRFASPAQAIEAGADYLVIGRPITAYAEPARAVEKIFEEIESRRTSL